MSIINTEIEEKMGNFDDTLIVATDARIRIAKYFCDYSVVNDGYTAVYQCCITGKILRFDTEEECIAFIAVQLGNLLLNQKDDHLKFLFRDLVVKIKKNGGYYEYGCKNLSITHKTVSAVNDHDGINLMTSLILNSLKDDVAAEAGTLMRRMQSVLSVL